MKSRKSNFDTQQRKKGRMNKERIKELRNTGEKKEGGEGGRESIRKEGKKGEIKKGKEE